MKTAQQKIETISVQQSEKMAMMIEKIQDGDMSSNDIISELKEVKKMIDIINYINHN